MWTPFALQGNQSIRCFDIDVYGLESYIYIPGSKLDNLCAALIFTLFYTLILQHWHSIFSVLWSFNCTYFKQCAMESIRALRTMSHSNLPRSHRALQTPTQVHLGSSVVSIWEPVCVHTHSKGSAKCFHSTFFFLTTNRFPKPGHPHLWWPRTDL